MGTGEEKQVSKSPKVKERTLYRPSSLGSQLNGDGDGKNGSTNVPLTSMNRANGSESTIGMRSRHSSGKSIRSRIASRAEYHEDLKPSLKQGLTKNLLFLAFVILFGSSFLFGYNLGVLNQPSTLIQNFLNETYTERYGALSEELQTLFWALTTSMFIPGGMLGALATGSIADKMGRKRAILFSHFFAFLGAILSTFCVIAKSPELLIVGRFFTGINCGMAANLAPMFITEITPFNLRGAFGCACQLFVTLGIFASAIAGLRELLGTVDLWPYLLLLNVIPAFFSLVILPFLPDSPRYLLLVKQKRLAAEKALQWLRCKEDIVTDIEEMETESQKGEKEKTWGMIELLRARDLLRPLIIACMLQVIQQLSGINAVMFYSGSIFENAGVPKSSIQYAILGVGALNFVMTIIAVPVMDKAGRRPLLLYPMACMVIIFGIMTTAVNLQERYTWMNYICVICVALYVVCFALGLGPIPWIIGAEMFRQGPRPRAMSLAGITNWFFTIIVAMTFPSIQQAIKAYTFIIFLVFMIGFTIFVYFFVPETKNKTFEEVASQYQPGGTIEVEEVFDEVFPIDMKEPIEETGEEFENLMNGDAKSSRNKKLDSVSSSKTRENEEKMSLTKSAEDIHVRL